LAGCLLDLLSFPTRRSSDLKIAMGMSLDEIELASGKASVPPELKYIVTKFPRFPFDKFDQASNILGTQMQATGEVMAIGSTFEEDRKSTRLNSSHVKISYAV